MLSNVNKDNYIKSKCYVEKYKEVFKMELYDSIQYYAYYIFLISYHKL